MDSRQIKLVGTFCGRPIEVTAPETGVIPIGVYVVVVAQEREGTFCAEAYPMTNSQEDTMRVMSCALECLQAAWPEVYKPVDKTKN